MKLFSADICVSVCTEKLDTTGCLLWFANASSCQTRQSQLLRLVSSFCVWKTNQKCDQKENLPKEDIVTSNNYNKENRPVERILKLLLLLGYLKDEFIADDQ